MPTRKLGDEKGRAAQIHALAHIELNAIDLACDMAGRFVPMGWITVSTATGCRLPPMKRATF